MCKLFFRPISMSLVKGKSINNERSKTKNNIFDTKVIAENEKYAHNNKQRISQSIMDKTIKRTTHDKVTEIVKENITFSKDLNNKIILNDHFKKLKKIDQKISMIKETDIDMYLATLKLRVNLNKHVLDKTARCLQEVDFLSGQRNLLLKKNECYDERDFLKLKENITKSITIKSNIKYEGIIEVQEILKSAMETLKSLKKMSQVRNLNLYAKNGILSNEEDIRED